MTGLSAEAVTVRRGGRAILDGVSLAIPPGALVAVIGPNGAGKSTLLAALAGLIAPDAGAVRLDGQPLAAVPRRELARRRAYLPQNAKAEWPLPVERLVALGLTPHLPAIRSALPDRMRPRIERALARFDLLDRRDQPATTLSGGELARAMLARVFVGDPELLILDEPFAGLDPRHVLDGAEHLKHAQAEGTTIVVSLHDLTLAARLATHVAALREGRLAAFGETAAVLTPERIGQLFEVEAIVTGEGAAARIDFRRRRA